MKCRIYSGWTRFFRLFVTLVYAAGMRWCGASVTYTVNYPTAVDRSATQVDLFLAATDSAQVEIDGTVKSLTSYTLRNETTSVLTSAHSINVISHDDFAAVVTKGQNSVLNMDGFRPLPHRGLGSDYTVSAWEPTVQGYSFVVLSAAVSAVTLTVQIPSWFRQEVTWQGTTYSNGDKITISLKNKESVQLNFPDHDPTGVRVWTADGTAFSVLSGTMATALNGSLPGNVYDVTPAYHLTSAFYVGVPIPGREEHIWRLVSTANATIAMFLVGRGGDGDESAPLDKGEHYDFRANSTTPVLIYSPNPGVATLYTPSDESSPPTMASLYPINLWHYYYVITPLDPTGVMLEHVTITIASASTGGVRMTSSNGVTTSVTGWTKFDSLLYSFDYVSVELSGVTSLWHMSDVPFQVIQSATNVGWAYAFSAGLNVGLGKPTTVSTITTTTSSVVTSTSTLMTSTSSPSAVSSTISTTVTSMPTSLSSLTSSSTSSTSSTSASTSSTSSSSPSSSSSSSSSAATSGGSTTSTLTLTTPLTMTSSRDTTTTSSLAPLPSSSLPSQTTGSTQLSSHTPAIINFTNTSTSTTSSNSTSSSFLPSWLDEASEWILAGAGLGGVILLIVSLTGVVIVVRKHGRRRKRRRPSSVSPNSSASTSSILVAPRPRPRMVLECGNLGQSLHRKPVRHKSLAFLNGEITGGHRVVPHSGHLKGVARPDYTRHFSMDSRYDYRGGNVGMNRLAPIDIA